MTEKLSMENIFLDNEVTSTFATGIHLSSFVQDERIERRGNRCDLYTRNEDSWSAEYENISNVVVSVLAEYYGSKGRGLLMIWQWKETFDR